MILNENPPPLHEFRPDIPPKLAAIVERAMEKQVVDRYQTGGEIAADLGHSIDSIGFLVQRRRELSTEKRFELARKLEFFAEFSDAKLEEVIDVGLWENYSGGVEILA